MLLIATNKSDLTSDYLILRLQERKIPFVRFNTEDLYFKAKMNFQLSKLNEQVTLEYSGQLIDIKDISGVYFRRPLPPLLESVIPNEDLGFAERELLEALTGFWRLIDNATWMNHPKHLFLAKNKIEQLKVAKNIGFNIPDTLISSDPNIIEEFYERHGEAIIVKAVKHGFYEQGNKVKIALTKEMMKDQIDNLRNYAEIPMIYQDKLDKLYDLRITVVGNQVFPTALYSQEHLISEVDWRVWDLEEKFELRHEKVEIPDNISEMCVSITKHFNLNFSAIDMVLTKENNYIFLEMNSNGQWAWIEEKVKYKLRDSIIDFLCGGSKWK